MSLAVGGDDAFVLTVVAQDQATTLQYAVNVARATSSDAPLAGLALSGGVPLAPLFFGETTSYAAAVVWDASSIDVVPSASETRLRTGPLASSCATPRPRPRSCA